MAARTPAQLLCLLLGIVLVARGLFGFVALDSSFATPGEGWHHLIHLVSGAVLLAADRVGERAALPAAAAFGIAYATLAVGGIAGGDDAFGLIGADLADKTFHVVIGTLSLLAAAVSLRRAGRPAS